MKRSLIVLAVALSTVIAPTFSVAFDASSVTPVLTFPEPSPEPVTGDKTDTGE